MRKYCCRFVNFGAGKSEEPVPPPDIVSTEFQIDENELDTLNLEVVGGKPDYTFELDGVDSDYFYIDGGTIKNNTEFDYENPIDDNEDNIYELDVIVTDSQGVGSKRTVTIEVIDIKEYQVIIIDEYSSDNLYKVDYEKDGLLIKNNTDDVVVTDKGNIEPDDELLLETDDSDTVWIGEGENRTERYQPYEEDGQQVIYNLYINVGGNEYVKGDTVFTVIATDSDVYIANRDDNDPFDVYDENGNKIATDVDEWTVAQGDTNTIAEPK